MNDNNELSPTELEKIAQALSDKAPELKPILAKIITIEKFSSSMLTVFNKLKVDIQNENEATNAYINNLREAIDKMSSENEEIVALIKGFSEESTADGGNIDEDSIRVLIGQILEDKGGSSGSMDTAMVDKMLLNLKEEILGTVAKLQKTKTDTQTKSKTGWLKYPITVIVCFAAAWLSYYSWSPKPYYELRIPAGEKIYYKDQNKSKIDPIAVTLRGDYTVSAADKKRNKYLFRFYNGATPYTYPNGEPITFYVYDTQINNNKVVVTKVLLEY